jgi:murein DD-endopeptidase MepM/ murein hydrolase activator NlpD
MAAILKGMIRQENGSCPYTDAQLLEAANRSIAFAGGKVDDKTLPLPIKPEPAASKAPIGVSPTTVPNATVNPPKQTSTFMIPAGGKYSSPFGMRTINGKSSMHQGIDIAAPIGTPILASAGGIVYHAGPVDGYGNLVVLDHGNGYLTYYGHLSSIGVKQGEQVVQGQKLGGMGNSGHSYGSHLHFGVTTKKDLSRKNDGWVNPDTVLSGLPNVNSFIATPPEDTPQMEEATHRQMAVAGMSGNQQETSLKRNGKKIIKVKE